MDIPGVDVVFTSDRTKWTRCAVIEESTTAFEAEGKVKKRELRKGRSVNQDGDTAVVSTDPAKNSDFIAPYGIAGSRGMRLMWKPGNVLILCSEKTPD